MIEKTYTCTLTQEQLDKICALIGATSGLDKESECLLDVYEDMINNIYIKYTSYIKEGVPDTIWLKEDKNG